MQEMIKRYDEVISQKVNKTALVEVEKKVVERYAKKDQLRDMHADHEQRIVKLSKDVHEVDQTVKN